MSWFLFIALQSRGTVIFASEALLSFTACFLFLASRVQNTSNDSDSIPSKQLQRFVLHSIAYSLKEVKSYNVCVILWFYTDDYDTKSGRMLPWNIRCWRACQLFCSVQRKQCSGWVKTTVWVRYRMPTTSISYGKCSFCIQKLLHSYRQEKIEGKLR